MLWHVCVHFSNLKSNESVSLEYWNKRHFSKSIHFFGAFIKLLCNFGAPYFESNVYYHSLEIDSNLGRNHQPIKKKTHTSNSTPLHLPVQSSENCVMIFVALKRFELHKITSGVCYRETNPWKKSTSLTNCWS